MTPMCRLKIPPSDSELFKKSSRLTHFLFLDNAAVDPSADPRSSNLSAPSRQLCRGETDAAGLGPNRPSRPPSPICRLTVVFWAEGADRGNSSPSAQTGGEYWDH